MNKLKYLLLFICLGVTTTVYAEDITVGTTNVVTSKVTSSTKSTTRSTTSYYSSSTDETSSVKSKIVNGNTVIVDDKADLLTDDQEESLMSEMEKLTEFGHIGFVSTNSATTTKDFADTYYHSKFGTQSGSIFVIDMDNRMVYIFSDGYNYNVINTSIANSITDNIYTYASKKDYYNCALKAFEQMYTVLNGGKISEPMRLISNVFLAFTISSIIIYLYALSTSSIKKAKSKELFDGINKEVKISDIKIVKKGTRSVYSPQSDSSGGSGGGGGGGGGSSGGGGGHSF